MRSTIAALAAPVVAALMFPSAAHAVFIQGNSAASTENLGRFTGEVTYTANTLTSGTLRISLSNTNSTSVGGYITGVVFNVPGIDTLASASLSSSTRPGFLNTGSESASPFGTYEAGAALGGSWLGGGSPNGGIAAGTTGVLTFTVTASDAASLTAEQFIGTRGMVLRFKGFCDGGSDKVPAQVVPTPATAALAGAAGVLALRRRRR